MRKTKINKIFTILKSNGFSFLIIKIMSKVLGVNIGVSEIKGKVWNILLQKHNYSVAYGPFVGMKLSKEVSWGDDRITQTLGIYEAHVLEKILDFARQGATKFIGIGACDGYFPIGLTFSKNYKKAAAFEISKERQRSILQNAIANNCQDKIKIYGEANLESLANEVKGHDKSTVLIDIEGDEYDLLSEESLSILSGSYLICELHHNLVENGLNQEKDLIKRAKKFFDVQLIKRETYNPNAFPEFDDLSDLERLVAVSEGRTKNTSWLVCKPK